VSRCGQGNAKQHTHTHNIDKEPVRIKRGKKKAAARHLREKEIMGREFLK